MKSLEDKARTCVFLYAGAFLASVGVAFYNLQDSLYARAKAEPAVRANYVDGKSAALVEIPEADSKRTYEVPRQIRGFDDNDSNVTTHPAP